MKNFLIVLVSFIVAMMFVILPIPGWLKLIWPDWVVLVLIYWVIMIPYRVNVGSAWILGLLLDVMFGTMLGEHAFALVCITYLATKFHIRIRNLVMFQQMLVIFGLLLLYRLIILWLQGIVGDLPNSFLYWLPILTGVVFWPWICSLLLGYSKRFQTNK